MRHHLSLKFSSKTAYFSIYHSLKGSDSQGLFHYTGCLGNDLTKATRTIKPHCGNRLRHPPFRKSISQKWGKYASTGNPSWPVRKMAVSEEPYLPGMSNKSKIRKGQNKGIGTFTLTMCKTLFPFIFCLSSSHPKH